MLLITNFLMAQNHDYNWLMGYGGQDPNAPEIGLSMLSFANGKETITSEDKAIMTFYQTCSSISDKTGKLAFYTNGCYIANAQHDSLKRGRISKRKTPYQIIQGALILPYPQKDSLYLVIHEQAGFFKNTHRGKEIDWYGAQKTFYSVVDMAKQEGKGEVIVNQKPFLPDSFYATYGRLTAFKQPDGINWWILIMESMKKRVLRYELTKDGLRYVSTQTLDLDLEDGVGAAVIAPDAKSFAYFVDYGSAYGQYLSVFDLDPCSALLSNLRKIEYKDTISGGGVAISPNSRYLYVALGDRIHQHDLKTNNLFASEKKVAEWDGFIAIVPTDFFKLQLAPNGKIYVGNSSATKYLHVIENPNLQDTLCTVKQHSIALPTYYHECLPYFPNFRQKAIDCTIATKEPDYFKYVAIAPNPTYGQVTLHFNLAIQTDLQLQILDISGNKLQQHYINQETTSFQIDLENYPTGCYFYLLTDKNGNKKSGKIVKM